MPPTGTLCFSPHPGAAAWKRGGYQRGERKLWGKAHKINATILSYTYKRLSQFCYKITAKMPPCPILTSGQCLLKVTNNWAYIKSLTCHFDPELVVRRIICCH